MKRVLIKIIVPIFGVIGGIGGLLEFIFRKDIGYENVEEYIDEYLEDHPRKREEIVEKFLNSHNDHSL